MVCTIEMSMTRSLTASNEGAGRAGGEVQASREGASAREYGGAKRRNDSRRASNKSAKDRAEHFLRIIYTYILYTLYIP